MGKRGASLIPLIPFVLGIGVDEVAVHLKPMNPLFERCDLPSKVVERFEYFVDRRVVCCAHLVNPS